MTDPSLQEQIRFYDRWNADSRAGVFDQIVPEIRRRGHIVVEHLRAAGLREPRILEVGCGTGWLSSKLVELGRVTAIDLSPKAIEIAQRRGIDASFIVGDFYEYEFAGASFDAVVCIETLFYVPDQQRFVAKPKFHARSAHF